MISLKFADILVLVMTVPLFTATINVAIVVINQLLCIFIYYTLYICICVSTLFIEFCVSSGRSWLFIENGKITRPSTYIVLFGNSFPKTSIPFFFLNNVIPGNYIFQTLSVRIMPWFILQSQQNILETFYTAKGDMQCMANANMRINSK